MDLRLTDQQLAFRDECRSWLEANNPGRPEGDERQRFAARIAWQRRMQEEGWAAVHWPQVFGGRGASLIEAALFFEEMANANAPLPANEIGLLLAGPTLMACGSPEQQARFLPPILTAEEIWCQGFSEPEAGSDLAAVRTRAVKEGGEWVITGQKVWTSFAHHANWCLLVARSDPDASRRHRGLSYFLLDMSLPGIEVRPIRQMTGEAEFNELFLERVRVPEECLVGGEGNGWQVALTTLMAERSGLGFYFQMTLRRRLDQLLDAAIANGTAADPVIADELAELHVRAEALRHLAWRGLTSVQQHGLPGASGSVTKWLWSETEQRLERLAVEILGTEMLTLGNEWSFQLLRGPGYTIEGGTTQIQQNIIAERILGLPKTA